MPPSLTAVERAWDEWRSLVQSLKAQRMYDVAAKYWPHSYASKAMICEAINAARDEMRVR